MPNYLKILICCCFASLIVGCGGGGGDDSDSSSGTNYGDLSGACSLRVTNGEQCSPTSGPIALVVTFDQAGNGIETCTGALVTPQHVLTAAHCFQHPLYSIGVRVGNETRFAKTYAIHPQYNPAKILNVFDAAVLTLAEPINNANTIPLLLSQDVSSGELINIAGFGKDENGNSFGSGRAFEESLHKGEMRVSGVDSSQGLFEADYSSTGESVCSGDSGGPVIQLNANGDPGIVGIALAVADPNPDGNEPTCLQGSTAAFSMVNFPELRQFIQSRAPGIGSN